MARKKEDNLIPYTSEQSREEAKKNGRKGGIASGEARRRKKSMQELAKIVNSLPLPNESKKGLPTPLQDEEDIATYQMRFVFMVYKQAVSGNVKAMKLWMELSNTYSEEKSKLEIKKLKAEINKLNVETNKTNDVEDLTPLAKLLMDDKEGEEDGDTDD